MSIGSILENIDFIAPDVRSFSSSFIMESFSNISDSVIRKADSNSKISFFFSIFKSKHFQELR